MKHTTHNILIKSNPYVHYAETNRSPVTSKVFFSQPWPDRAAATTDNEHLAGIGVTQIFIQICIGSVIV